MLKLTGSDYQIRITSVDEPAVSGTSGAVFSVITPIRFYYVNDGSTAGDVYTTVAGNDAFDGLSPDQPKATLRGILDTYDLGAGDVVLVDTGLYALGTNVVIAPQDSGAEIRGAGADKTVLNRGNTNSGAYVFDLQGADVVTIRGVGITGAQYGVFAGSSADSDRISIVDSWVYSNSVRGVELQGSNDFVVLAGNRVWGNGSGGINLNGTDVLVQGNEVLRNGSAGIDLNGERARVLDNDVYGQTGWGIQVNGSSTAGVAASVVQGNRVFSNAYGISGAYSTLVQDNDVWGNTSGQGIQLYYGGAKAEGNRVWGNASYGIYVYFATATGNQVWANASHGIYSDYGSETAYNRIYGNGEAGVYLGIYDGWVHNNLIEANAGPGVLVNGASFSSSTPRVENNTIAATGAANAITVQGSTSSIWLRNNILDVRGTGHRGTD